MTPLLWPEDRPESKCRSGYAEVVGDKDHEEQQEEPDPDGCNQAMVIEHMEIFAYR